NALDARIPERRRTGRNIAVPIGVRSHPFYQELPGLEVALDLLETWPGQTPRSLSALRATAQCSSRSRGLLVEYPRSSHLSFIRWGFTIRIWIDELPKPSGG